MFPEFAHHKIYGAVASFSDFNNVRQLAANYGLFVLGQAGQSLKVLNKKVRNPLKISSPFQKNVRQGFLFCRDVACATSLRAKQLYVQDKWGSYYFQSIPKLF